MRYDDVTLLCLTFVVTDFKDMKTHGFRQEDVNPDRIHIVIPAKQTAFTHSLLRSHEINNVLLCKMGSKVNRSITIDADITADLEDTTCIEESGSQWSIEVSIEADDHFFNVYRYISSHVPFFCRISVNSTT